MADPDAPKPVTFPVYFDRWFGGTRHLSLSARGAYFDWLAWCFAQNRPLPLGIDARARIAACTHDEAEQVWREVEPKWVRTPAGYVNHSLEAKRTEQTDWLAAQRAKGIRGAAVRWKGHQRKWPEKRKRSAPATLPANGRETTPGVAGRVASFSISISKERSDPAKNLDLAKERNTPHSSQDRFAARNTHALKAHRNPKALLKLAIHLAKHWETDEVRDFTEELKDRASGAGLLYTGPEIHRAVTRALKVAHK